MYTQCMYWYCIGYGTGIICKNDMVIIPEFGISLQPHLMISFSSLTLISCAFRCRLTVIDVLYGMYLNEPGLCMQANIVKTKSRTGRSLFNSTGSIFADSICLALRMQFFGGLIQREHKITRLRQRNRRGKNTFRAYLVHFFPCASAGSKSFIIRISWGLILIYTLYTFVFRTLQNSIRRFPCSSSDKHSVFFFFVCRLVFVVGVFLRNVRLYRECTVCQLNIPYYLFGFNKKILFFFVYASH